MTAHESILGLLDSNNVSYDRYEHEPVYTSEQAARVRGDVDVHQGSPTS